MCNAIPYTGNTADQAVSTVTVQLGAAEHHTRPLTLFYIIINYNGALLSLGGLHSTSKIVSRACVPSLIPS